MPTYAYACTACSHAFEAVQSFSDDSLTVCPECDGRLRKVFSSVGVVFKGSGFYRNDARAGAKSSTLSPRRRPRPRPRVVVLVRRPRSSSSSSSSSSSPAAAPAAKPAASADLPACLGAVTSGRADVPRDAPRTRFGRARRRGCASRRAGALSRPQPARRGSTTRRADPARRCRRAYGRPHARPARRPTATAPRPPTTVPARAPDPPVAVPVRRRARSASASPRRRPCRRCARPTHRPSTSSSRPAPSRPASRCRVRRADRALPGRDRTRRRAHRRRDAVWRLDGRPAEQRQPARPGLIAADEVRGPPGTVVATVRFADPAVAGLLSAGMHVDVLAATAEGGPGGVVATPGARPAGRPPDRRAAGRCSAVGGSGDDSVPVLVAVSPDEAPALAGAAASALLSAVVVP